MHKNLHDNILIILFSVVLFVIVIFGSMNIMIYDKSFYNNEYGKTGVYEKVSADPVQGKIIAENITDNVVGYFRGRAELGYFNEIEKSHMGDVKSRINLMSSIYYVCVILSLILFFYAYFKYKKDSFLFIKILL